MKKETQKKIVKFMRFVKAYNKEEKALLILHPVGFIILTLFVFLAIGCPFYMFFKHIPNFLRSVYANTFSEIYKLKELKGSFVWRYDK